MFTIFNPDLRAALRVATSLSPSYWRIASCTRSHGRWMLNLEPR